MTEQVESGPPTNLELQRTSRDPEQLRRQLESWLAHRLGPTAQPTISDIAATTANGMSSETVLFRADWTQEDVLHSEALVARVAPDASDVPVFPSYDMDRQFRIIQLVGDLTPVPVPRVLWSEPDASAIGAPFFVMERVSGDVPPDVMPYTFGDNWLFDAPVERQRQLQDSTVSLLTELHTLTGDDESFAFLQYAEPGDSPLRRHVNNRRAWYEYVAACDRRSPLVDRVFEWLDEHWPADEGDPVVSWGDSRIGNIMYRDFTPVAVLDWEMVGVGPRELDIAWLVFAHRVFQDLASGYALAGMPEFLRWADVAASYEKATGYSPRDLEFYGMYCAVQWAIVFLRTGQRSVHFGERESPADVDEFIMHRESVERMLAGTYWS
ncbi:MAG: phosphotransferase family protein [Actinomycetes bacterium]